MLKLAIAKLGITEDMVLSHRVYGDDHISLVVDYGIEGGKKFKFAQDDLAVPVVIEQAKEIDFATYTINDVIDMVTDGLVTIDKAIEIEQKGRNRVTLINRLEDMK